MTAEYKLSCRNLWKVFGPTPEQVKPSIRPGQSRAEIQEQTGHLVAVRDVTFGVRKGQTFVVMGLSGSGKSTLVRCILRLIEPTSGQVIIDGEDVTAMNPRQLRALRGRKLSMVFQHFGLLPHRTVLDNVAYGLEVQGVKRESRHARARETLQLVGLAEWAGAYPNQLSGGMQQRVGIARALAVDPEILLFDEPFSALDPLIRREMQDELLKLQHVMHKTILFITHDFLEAVKLGDNIAIMKDGEVVQVGAPDQLILNPANDYVREFTKDVPRSRVLLARMVMRPCRVVCSEHDPPAAVRSQLRPGETAFVRAESGRFLGLLSSQQLEQAAAAPTVGSLANSNPPTVTPGTTLRQLIPLVAASELPLPVVDSSQKLLGAVDRQTVLAALGEAI